ncbi:hypothetical protein [Paucisalibacillus sp. EB02]|uniref:hypothetical protein n=1 Tax=Paucisalibacillus sp. EB02 TaxID=1347087 RepID=UPI0004BC358F|nr:hypothetical protein [Paucisalibacillus sp. EB02]
MKKNMVIGILVLSCFLLMLLSSSLYKEIRNMKNETGMDYYHLVSDTRYFVREIKETNLEEALETDSGKQFLSSYIRELQDKQKMYFKPSNNIHEIGNMLRDVQLILEEALKKGTITDEEETSVKKSLEIIGFILLDLQVLARDNSWYDLFNDRELKEEIIKKME